MKDKLKLIENSKERLKDQIRNTKYIENAAGFLQTIDTLTAISADIVTQKFYEIKISDYIPVKVGANPWLEQSLTWKTFSIGGSFESGIIETGSYNAKAESMDTQFESVITKRKVWKKGIVYNLAELSQANASTMIDLITQKEIARKTNWDLGIQKVAFLGLPSEPSIDGLLNQSGVTSNTALITKTITSMTPTEFQAFLGGILPEYFSNSDSTAMPDTFLVPTSDYLGLPTAVDEAFGLVSRLERIEKALKAATGNPNFKVLNCAYGQSAISGLGVTRYVLYRQDPYSLNMEIPVDYTTTIADTINGFDYQSAAYGQFSGTNLFRPKEMLYFDF